MVGQTGEDPDGDEFRLGLGFLPFGLLMLGFGRGLVSLVCEPVSISTKNSTGTDDRTGWGLQNDVVPRVPCHSKGVALVIREEKSSKKKERGIPRTNESTTSSHYDRTIAHSFSFSFSIFFSRLNFLSFVFQL